MSELKANPGGIIAPEHVIGRDELIADLWDMLESSSIRLVAERRIGKTSIIRKMAAEAPSNKIVRWHDVSKITTLGEFAELVYKDVEEELSKKQKYATKTRQLMAQLGGVEFSKVKLPQIAAHNWKTLLEHTIADLTEQSDRDIVFLWDEMPWMLDKIRKGSTDGEKQAMELLDTLRALRQTYPKLRMVLTGSIGLHHVLTALRGEGYRNTPLNDAPIFEVPPLELEEAKKLALVLLRSEGIPTTNEDDVAAALAAETGGIAFYIHHLVVLLRKYKRWSEEVSPQIIEQLLAAALEDDQDKWEFRHYRERIDAYYGTQSAIVKQILDEVVTTPAGTPITAARLLNAVRSTTPTIDNEQLLGVIELLRQDHYLTVSGGRYAFRYALIGRWWRVHRGLEIQI